MCKRDVRAGRGCPGCLSLPRVLCVMDLFAGVAQYEQKSLTHSISPSTPTSTRAKQSTRHLHTSCPQRGSQGHRRYGLSVRTNCPAPQCSNVHRTWCSPKKWPYPFQHPYPSHEKQPITISIASNCYGPAVLQAASDATFKFRPDHILAIIAFMHMYIYACSRTDCTVAVSTTPPMR